MRRVYLNPPPGLSKAMHRVAAALRHHAPPQVRIVERSGEADLQVLHVIGVHGLDAALAQAPEFAIIQYCLASAGAPMDTWARIWRRARLVWSYYDLGQTGARTYLAPLGVDGAIFKAGREPQHRHYGVITSGYVNGAGAEAIEEVAIAAQRRSLRVFHLGPPGVANMDKRTESTWTSKLHVSDEALADIYGQALWVSGLRYVEGFELPVIEGLACGARPIVFDRPDMRRWYDGLAVFVPETTGRTLVESLVEVFSSAPQPVTEQERAEVLSRFNWRDIAEGFWREVLA